MSQTSRSHDGVNQDQAHDQAPRGTETAATGPENGTQPRSGSQSKDIALILSGRPIHSETAHKNAPARMNPPDQHASSGDNPRATPTTRGVTSNPVNRFESIQVEPDPDWYDEDERPPRTEFIRDHSQTIISYNDSPDLNFRASVNPYRGCEHGCVYCYARPTHEYAGMSAGLDFESKILIKPEAPELLRKELSTRRWKPQLIAMSGGTDCYQPVERKLRITRACLEVLAEARNPVAIITKNDLVTRDLDLLAKLNEHKAAAVFISLTTLDADLRKRIEPRTSPPKARLKAIRKFAEAGIPAGVMIAPAIPALNEPEIPALLEAAAEAGARHAALVPLRLPLGVADMFEAWLEEHFPMRKEKILNRIRDMRDGRMNDANFGSRMQGKGVHAEQMRKIFEIACRKVGVNQGDLNLSTDSFRRPEGDQLTLL